MNVLELDASAPPSGGRRRGPSRPERARLGLAGLAAVDAEVGSIVFNFDEQFCRDLADRFDQAPMRSQDSGLKARYAQAIAQTRRQYDRIVAAGIRVIPWRGDGPAYAHGRALCDDVKATASVRLLLTESALGQSQLPEGHPLSAPSGVSACGVALCHNDLLRVVHDVFGHVIGATGFGPAGELVAAYRHMALYSPAAKSVLMSEQVAQVCWFYYGPHLRNGHGDLPRRGDEGYVRPQHRPYAPQKVFAIEAEYLDRFSAMFGASSRLQ
ncbi:MAG: hypothetical protein AAFX85_00690 [Pseudomonadota bacterium]